MIICPACGKKQEALAVDGNGCRAPLRDEPMEESAEGAPVEAGPPPPAEEAISSDSLGEVCRRCEAYNEPGVTVCTNCGTPLGHVAPAAEPEPAAQPFGGDEEATLDKTPPQPYEATAADAPPVMD